MMPTNLRISQKLGVLINFCEIYNNALTFSELKDHKVYVDGALDLQPKPWLILW